MCMLSDEREKCGWVRAKEDAKLWIFAMLERNRLDFGSKGQRSRRRNSNIEVTRNGCERLNSVPLALRYHFTMSLVSLTSDHVDVDNTAPSSIYRNFLKFLLDIPPRFLARLRSLDRLLDREAESNQAISFLLSYGTDPGAPVAHMTTPPPSTFPHYPGPWSFFASGYAVSLCAMVRRTHSMLSNTSLSAQRHCS